MKNFLCLLLILITLPSSAFPQTPNLKLAKIYQQGINLNEYLVSEKYDGVRAYWNGHQLISKQGHIFNAPHWFIKDFGNTALDGELWIARQRFDELSGIVRRKHGDHQEWQKIQYRVFDLPHHSGKFSQRYKDLISLIQQSTSTYLKLVIQESISDHDTLMNKLDALVSEGAEGLMLQRKNAPYQGKRSNDLIKVKLWEDAEARVIKYFPGKGKFTGIMGSMLVETQEGIQFRIGSGFSYQQRVSPPPINTNISYKYYGINQSGKPRFASFLRIRADIP